MAMGIGEKQIFDRLVAQVQAMKDQMHEHQVESTDRLNKLNGDVSYLKGLLKQKGIKVENGVSA